MSPHDIHASRTGKAHALRRADRKLHGFSLVELMIAMMLGAVLLTSVASVSGSMSQSIAQLQSESTDSYDKAMARIARDVRYAWWVDVPSRSQLRIADSDNRVTEYYRVGNSLLVRLPTGEEGSVVTGLDGVNFTADRTQRLREAAIRPVSGRIHGVPATVDPAAGLKMLPGNSIAVAFIARSDAGAGSVAGVNENVTAYTPDRIDLQLAKTTSTGSVRIDIYPARAPGDSRPLPGAAPLSGFDVDFSVVPTATAIAPPTNPLDPNTANYYAPTTKLPLAVPAFLPRLEPGVAYSAVITVNAGSMAVLAGHLAASPNPGVQWRQAPGQPWFSMAGVVPFAVFGGTKQTSTSAADVVRSVEINMDPSDTVARSSTVVVHSQVMAADPWLGVIPGETAP
ncbi:MAG: PilW family protein [Planctomycetota bacterium]|jgi:prepilin-type N-terminal cleavage/methylation domain-containing protein